VRRVRARVGSRFPLSVKLNSADFQRGGFSEEESMAVVELLDAEGIDLLEVSGGTFEATAMFEDTVPKHASSRAREAFFLEYAERVRARTSMPLMVTGGFRTKAGMSAALSSGAAQVVGLARPLALEPDLPARLLSGRATQAHPVRLSTGNKKLDALVQAAWHQTQINRMALGRDPDPALGRARAVASYALPQPRFALAGRKPVVRAQPAQQISQLIAS
jgi:2,4-dienoyl-CoA reductase-like NADH-dependent reductase (Old Yellow Enzyme family)